VVAEDNNLLKSPSRRTPVKEGNCILCKAASRCSKVESGLNEDQLVETLVLFVRLPREVIRIHHNDRRLQETLH